MVRSGQNLQPSFRALGDPTRRQILVELAQEDLTISEVVDKFDLTRTAVRKHLTILEEGNLITLTQKGKERITSLNPAGVKLTADWFRYFDQYWDTALNSLKKAVENKPSKSIKKNSSSKRSKTPNRNNK